MCQIHDYNVRIYFEETFSASELFIGQAGSKTARAFISTNRRQPLPELLS